MPKKTKMPAANALVYPREEAENSIVARFALN